MRPLQGKAMSAWHATGVLTADDKQVISAATAVELGIRLDGRLGLLGASPERLFKTALATVHVLQKHGGSVKDAQIILGTLGVHLAIPEGGNGGAVALLGSY